MQEGCHYTLVWVSAYLGMGRNVSAICTRLTQGGCSEAGATTTYRVIGDAADPHQHERDLLPEGLQDGVCKAGAPLDRSREAHARYSAALRSMPYTAMGSQWRVMGVPSTRLARSTILWTAVVRCERRVDGLKQGGVAKRFGEEGHRARLQRLGAHGFGPMRRQKNNRELGLARA